MAIPFEVDRARALIAAADWRIELSARGWPAHALAARANIEKPDIVRDAADAFLDGGADILVTNTSAVNAAVLIHDVDAGRISTEELSRMTRIGAELCRTAVREFPAAADPRPARDRYVVGAMGPTERLLLLSEIGEAVLAEAYEAQARTLADAGVDAIVCGGFHEAAALEIAARSALITGRPVIATLVFDSGADYTETSLGDTVPQACELLGEVGVTAIGCDGGEHPQALPAIVAAIRSRWTGPIWVSMPAGYPQLIDEKVVYSDSPKEYGGRLEKLRRAGSNIIACGRGTSAEHVAALAQARDRG